jgi:hypothetical protein
MSNTSKAQRLAIELAWDMIAEIDQRARQGITEPLSPEQNAHLVGLISERHNLKPKQIKAMLREAPFAMQEVQTMVDAIAPKT